ncbi:MAG: hypothetical protein JWN15_2407 [Firmicutes bacterium]|nr:hypothetical protein [Bacillota bacterium]
MDRRWRPLEETGSDRQVPPQQSAEEQTVAATASDLQQFRHNLSQVALHPSPDPIDTVTSGLFFWGARQ